MISEKDENNNIIDADQPTRKLKSITVPNYSIVSNKSKIYAV